MTVFSLKHLVTGALGKQPEKQNAEVHPRLHLALPGMQP